MIYTSKISWRTKNFAIKSFTYTIECNSLDEAIKTSKILANNIDETVTKISINWVHGTESAVLFKRPRNFIVKEIQRFGKKKEVFF